MPKRGERPTVEWKVQSVSVKARDGPERLALAYRRLMVERPRTGPSSGTSAQPPVKQEGAQ
jgi:hypothetical protein